MHTKLFARDGSTKSNFEKKKINSDMHHRVTYMYVFFFSKIGVVGLDQSKPCTQIYLQIIGICINLQLPIVIFIKLIISDMHHRITSMCINFQQVKICRSVKTMNTKLNAKNRKLIA